MVTLVKHEWHQVDAQFAYELDADKLSEIYPELDEDEIVSMLQQIADGEIDLEELLQDAYDNNVEIEWDRQYDDWWTDRKGGYEVTFEVGDDSSWHSEPEPNPPTHKCTKCRWEGDSWATRTAYIDDHGNVLPDDCDEYHDTKDVCPMCDSDVTLTEFGKEDEAARAKRIAEFDAMFADDDEPECEI
jgi:hypothetical protein